MAKRPVSIQVDTIVYKQAGFSAILYLDKKTLIFHAKFMDQTFRGATADEVKTQVMQAMIRAADLEWNPVIEVTKLAPFGASIASVGPNHPPWVGFTLDRFYVAKRYNETYAKVDWNHADQAEGRSWVLEGMSMQSLATTFYWPNQQEFNPPTILDRGGDRSKHYLPYTLELWEGLVHLQQAIRTLGERLEELMGTPAGIAMLTTVGQRLLLALPAPGQEEEQ